MFEVDGCNTDAQNRGLGSRLRVYEIKHKYDISNPCRLHALSNQLSLESCAGPVESKSRTFTLSYSNLKVPMTRGGGRGVHPLYTVRVWRTNPPPLPPSSQFARCDGCTISTVFVF